jgi:hypothetical protein
MRTARLRVRRDPDRSRDRPGTGGTLLEDAFAQLDGQRDIWRAQVSILGLAYCLMQGEQVASHAPPRVRQVVGRNVGLWLARMALGLSWRDVASGADVTQSALARALAWMERMEDARPGSMEPSSRAAGGHFDPGFWAALDEAEQAVNHVRQAVIAACGSPPSHQSGS